MPKFLIKTWRKEEREYVVTADTLDAAEELVLEGMDTPKRIHVVDEYMTEGREEKE